MRGAVSSRDAPRAGGGFDEAGHGHEHLGLVQQEGVVAFVARDLDEADRCAEALSACTTSRDSTVGNSQST